MSIIDRINILFSKNKIFYFIIATTIIFFILNNYLGIVFFNTNYLDLNKGDDRVATYLIINFIKNQLHVSEIEHFINYRTNFNFYNTQFAILKILSTFLDEIVKIHTSYIYIVCLLNFFSCFFVLNDFVKKNKTINFCLSVLFTFTPFAINNFTENIFALSYYSVPLIFYLLMSNISHKNIYFFSIYLLLIINSGVDFLFYFLLLFVSKSIFFNKGSNKNYSNFILIIFLIFLSLFINKILYGKYYFILNIDENFKFLELQSLNLIKLFLPVENHWLSFFGNISTKYKNIMYAIPFENSSSSLGFLISILVFFLFFYLVFFKIIFNNYNVKISKIIDYKFLNQLTVYFLIIILFSIIGGFGIIFSTLFISVTNFSTSAIFIYFIGILILQNVLALDYKAYINNKSFIFVCICILFLSLIDQVGRPKPFISFIKNEKITTELKEIYTRW